MQENPSPSPESQPAQAVPASGSAAAPSPAPPAQALPPAPDDKQKQERMWHMYCHLSALSGFIVPFGNILGPLLIWQIKKNEMPSIEPHGKGALNFQITVGIIVLASIILAILLSFFCIGIIFIPIAMAAQIVGLVFAVIAGIKANDGKDYRYPYAFNLVK